MANIEHTMPDMDSDDASILTVIGGVGGIATTIWAIFLAISGDWGYFAFALALNLICSWGWFYMRYEEGREDFYHDWSSDPATVIYAILAVLGCFTGLASVSSYDLVVFLASRIKNFHPVLWLKRSWIRIRRRMNWRDPHANLTELVEANLAKLEAKKKQLEAKIALYDGLPHSAPVIQTLQAKIAQNEVHIALDRNLLTRLAKIGECEEAELVGECEALENEAESLAAQVEATEEFVATEKQAREDAEVELKTSAGNISAGFFLSYKLLTMH